MQITKLYLRRIVFSACIFAAIFSQSSFAEPNASLERVLASMDKAAATFRTLEADFVWDQYQKVVDETETQKGKIYFRRAGNEVQMMADVTGPDPEEKKSVLFADSKVQLYQPKSDQVTIYNTSKNPEVESYLVLGFGGRGHDLSKSFDVTYLGSEKIGDVQTEKINLVPKSEKVKNNFDHIIYTQYKKKNLVLCKFAITLQSLKQFIHKMAHLNP